MAIGKEHSPGTAAPIHPAQAPVSLWRNRDFLLLWLGQAVSAIGGEVSSLAVPLLVLALTRSPQQAGIVAATGALPPLLLSLPAGVLVDRLDRKRLMIACDVLRAVNLAGIPVALALGRFTLAQLYLFAVVEGACAAIFNLANIVCIQRVVPREQLPDAIARREASEGAVRLLGPSLGGVLFLLGRAVPFVVDAASYTASIGSLLLIRTPFQGQRSASTRQRLRDEVGQAMVWLWHQPLLRFMSLVYGGFALFFAGGELCIILLAQRRGASPVVIGLIFALGGVGGILGALAGPTIRRRVPFGRLLPLLHWGYALLWPLYVVMPAPLLMGVVEAVFLANDQVYDIVWPSYRIALIPDALQGRVTSVYRLLVYALKPLGLALTGLLCQRIGPDRTMLCWGACIIALAAVVTLNPHVRHARPIAEVAAEH
jgi:hypothetical protein